MQNLVNSYESERLLAANDSGFSGSQPTTPINHVDHCFYSFSDSNFGTPSSSTSAVNFAVAQSYLNHHFGAVAAASTSTAGTDPTSSNQFAPWIRTHPHTKLPSGAGTNNIRVRTRDKYRMVYSDYQRLELEKEFYHNQYITTNRKTELSTHLGLTERQIKIWFQNRRAKDRKLKKRSATKKEGSSMGSEDRNVLTPSDDEQVNGSVLESSLSTPPKPEIASQNAQQVYPAAYPHFAGYNPYMYGSTPMPFVNYPNVAAPFF